MTGIEKSLEAVRQAEAAWTPEQQDAAANYYPCAWCCGEGEIDGEQCGHCEGSGETDMTDDSYS